VNLKIQNIVHEVSMTEKIKILTIGDHPLSPSGVGIQSKYVITALLETGKFSVYSMAGALKHEKYATIKTKEFGDDWLIQPVDGYGNADTVRSIVRFYKPDIIWFMTDPRFYGWLWEIENEIRPQCPLVYYHVWDNFPHPDFNKVWYDSTDVIASISKLTSNIVRTVSPNVDEVYIPHAVPTDTFLKRSEYDVKQFRNNKIGIDDDCFMIFWSNRNARRKQSGSLMFWYKQFLDELEKKHGHRNAMLFMHTEPTDPNGQNLYAIATKLGIDVEKKILFSRDKMSPEDLSMVYTCADCSISVSDAEGFGLFTFESLACETPIIVTMTGGLQEQVTLQGEVSHEHVLSRNDKHAGTFIEYDFGIGLEPSSKAIIGSQQVPWIYEDRLNDKQVVDALMQMYEYGPEKRAEIGAKGRQHVLDNYSFTSFRQSWVDLMERVYKEHGSYENRKGYKGWELIAI
jgi:glycosyltransferase involved in cell wall biosynthesis